MNLGIFGGRFDPIHIGHLINMTEILEEFNLDKILIVLSYTPPHKDVDSSFKDRKEMIKLSIKGNPYFELSEIEKEIKGKSYTIKVLKKLKEKYSNSNLFFIMGADEMKIIKTWYKYEEISQLAKIIVLRRPNVTDFRLEGNAVLATNSLLELSSSVIRKRVKNNKSIRYMVPDDVRNYIKNKGLYL